MVGVVGVVGSGRKNEDIFLRELRVGVKWGRGDGRTSRPTPPLNTVNAKWSTTLALFRLIAGFGRLSATKRGSRP